MLTAGDGSGGAGPAVSSGRMNGAAARLIDAGHKVIIMSFAGYEGDDARTHRPIAVFVDEEPPRA